jgi:hypothetical protein
MDENESQGDVQEQRNETPKQERSERHAKRHHARRQAQRHEAARQSPSSGFPQGALIAIVIVLGVLVIASSYFVGYFVGKQGAPAGGTVVKAPVVTPPAQQPAAQQAPATPNVPKTEKPKVELFIMSYCPYGLQMQKAYVPAAKLLAGKADMTVKWVSYAMHGEKEVQENTRQYCIQKEQADKYLAYATCFVGSTDTAACQKEAGIDATKLQTCYDAADKQFSISANFADKASWLSGQFPQYNVDKAANQQYGVQGSPTMVINGQQVQIGRSSEAVKQAICAAFTTPPKECQTALNTAQENPGAGPIGAGTAGAGAAAAAACG